MLVEKIFYRLEYTKYMQELKTFYIGVDLILFVLIMLGADYTFWRSHYQG